MSTDDLHRRLERLESLHDIERLHYRYAECVDRAMFDELGELFRHGRMTANVSDDAMSGSDQVREFYRATNRVHADGTPRTRHVATNIMIDLADDHETASARSYFVVLQATDDLPLQPIVAGRYHDTFRRIDGDWWFDVRLIHVDQIGDMHEHLSFDLTTERVNVAEVLDRSD